VRLSAIEFSGLMQYVNVHYAMQYVMVLYAAFGLHASAPKGRSAIGGGDFWGARGLCGAGFVGGLCGERGRGAAWGVGVGMVLSSSQWKVPRGGNVEPQPRAHLMIPTLHVEAAVVVQLRPSRTALVAYLRAACVPLVCRLCAGAMCRCYVPVYVPVASCCIYTVFCAFWVLCAGPMCRCYVPVLCAGLCRRYVLVLCARAMCRLCAGVSD
jgi:hypothetical protein